MSLTLTRRIAQAALLLGAAAAPLIGAGAAHAAAPQQAVGGLTNLDGAGLGSAVDGTSQHAAGLATKGGTEAVKTTVPAAGRIIGTAGRAATPAAQQSAAQATDTAGRIVGATAESLPVAGALPNTGALPTDQLPLKALPLG
ncbi:ATP-binding protein [Streptomyces sp. NBC_01198]|uniref:ATP-binding protein n=1 Tax=Streptomyces sp. NBC_01198 TaxID=2903769 RepID=UPI002E0E8022|nr:ATP-binding protein [Streptomyces sp. NBC_01198]